METDRALGCQGAAAVSGYICPLLPSFYVLNALAGLRDDFPRVVNAVLGFQSLSAIVLAALAPITELMNLSTTAYSFMLFWSGIMFALATVCGQWKMNSLYRPLIASNPRHRLLAIGWIALFGSSGFRWRRGCCDHSWVLRACRSSSCAPKRGVMLTWRSRNSYCAYYVIRL